MTDGAGVPGGQHDRAFSSAHLRWLLERAAEDGATHALRRIGLEDEEAMHDVHELRDLLRAWREARRKAWSTAIGWVTTATLVGISAALALGWWERRG